MKNHLFLDVETTGLNEFKQDIIQLACIPVIGGKELGSFNEYCQPISWDNIQQEALNIHGITLQQLRTFQSPISLAQKLITFLRQFNCKFIISGQNSNFDKKFVSAFFSKLGLTNEYAEFFEHAVHDTLPRAKSLDKSILPVQNYKLETLCKHFNIDIKAHDALSDIRATYLLDKELSKLLGESDDYISTASNVLINSKLEQPALLHTHSQFSILDGILTPEDWIEHCLKNNIPGISFVDHGFGASLFRAVRAKDFIKDYNKENKTSYSQDAVTCVPGLGINVSMDSDINEHYSLNAWAISNQGYFNLMKISSLGFDSSIEEDDRTIPINHIDDLVSHSEGIIFGLADVDSYVGDAVLKGDEVLAEKRLLDLRSKLPSLVLEMCSVDITHLYDKKTVTKRVPKNNLITDGNLQKAYNIFLSKMVDKYGFKCIPTSNSCFINASDKKIQDCMCQNGYSDGFMYHSSYHYLSTDEMYKTLKSHLSGWMTEEKYNIMCKTTHDILEQAKKIDIKFNYLLPDINIPDHIKNITSDKNEQLKLFTLDRINFHGRYINNPEYVERLKKELDVIVNNSAMNFLPYFLMYEDLGCFARNAGFLQNIARGSAGGSLLSYYLKIIHVDPVKANLPFERFLSFARINAGSWPDIDMDISKSARPHLMRYLKSKYGLGFAQIATYSTMKVKNAIKDAMFFLYERRRNDFEIEALCKTIEDSPQGVDEYDFLYGYTDKEGEYHQGCLEKNPELQKFFARYTQLEPMVKRLIGIVRGFSRHASAFAISTEDISSTRIPTMRMWDKHMQDYINVTQYSGPMVEKSGIVKADILGLKTLSSVTDSVFLIKQNHGIDLLEEENGVPLIYRLPEDKGVYNDFRRKDTDSSFQFNSGVIKACIEEFEPNRREELSALTALKRPGAMDCFIDEDEGITADVYYTLVKNGKEKVRYIHPDLEPILRDTNGVFVYQETVFKCLVEICGYSWEESDVVRSAIAKKKHEVIMATFDRIRVATKARGWTDAQADELCKTIMAFSRYSFNRSHSYAYAELGYVTMYLKHHFPNEWWCSVLNHEDDEDKTRAFFTLLGDKIKPPSMKNPSDKFSIMDNKIYAPITSVKSVGQSAAKELTEKGPFASLQDFLARVDHSKVNIGVVRQLIKARAADSLMDQNLEYGEARLKFMDEYAKTRKSKTGFGDEMKNVSPISIYMMEKESNLCFNTSMMSVPDIREKIQASLKGLKEVNNPDFPMMLNKTLIMKDLAVATTYVGSSDPYVQNQLKNQFGIFLQLKDWHQYNGVSKRTGKEFSSVKAQMTDGYITVETIDFFNKAYMIQPDSIVFIKGIFSKGFKSPISIKVEEITEVMKARSLYETV